MASHLKREREPISYKEPSSDEDDFEEESDVNPSPRKKKALPQRSSTRLRTSPQEGLPPRSPQRDAPQAASASNSSKRRSTERLRKKRRVSYRETTTDEDDQSDGYFEAASPPSQRRAAPEASPRRPGSSNARDKRVSKTPKKKNSKRRELGSFKVKKGVHPNIASVLAFSNGRIGTPTPSLDIVSDGKIPSWASLPYHVLLQIFVYAAHPLHDESMRPMPAIAWLAKTARLCRNFTKPALTALYRNPPIFSMRQSRTSLVNLLASPPANAYLDYPVMVKRLELNASQMSHLTGPQTSLASLVALIKSLRTLKDIDIFDSNDAPPYREKVRNSRRWQYPPELFEAIKETDLRLHSWRWKENYCSKDLSFILDIHNTPVFQSLREINLTRFRPIPFKNPEEHVTAREELLGSAVTALPNLRAITFESCDILDGVLLSLLPTRLSSLTITNCVNLTSEHLQAFLVTHGANLEVLILNHNRSLNLSFITTLKQTCPRLEIFRMDTHYFGTMALSPDNEPLYDELLYEGEIPTWPTTLRSIDLEFLRNWTSSAAVAFFTSLIQAAGEMTWLRELVLTAIVTDIDWRERAEFRRRWTERFARVFLREGVGPDQALVSYRAYREAQERAQAGGEAVNAGDGGKENEDVNAAAGKKKGKERTVEDAITATDTPTDTEDDLPLRSRLRDRAMRLSYKEASSSLPATRDDDTKPLIQEPLPPGNNDNDGEEGDGVDDAALPVQGLCHTVLFRVDNSRPQEQLFDEEDFLDEEASGDEDWNGDGGEFEGEEMAW